MQKHLMKFVGGVAFALLVSLGQSHAAVIVSNLADPVNGTGGVYTGAQPQDYAQEFMTGSQSVALGSIIAPLGTAVPSFSPSAELVANVGGLPGDTALTTFPVPTIPTSSPTALTFTPTSSVMLSANTDYWFILSATGAGGSFKWQYTDTTSASFPNYASSHDGGVTWTIESGGPFLMEVDSAALSPAPEPSSSVLVCFAGLLGFGVVLACRCKREDPKAAA